MRYLSTNTKIFILLGLLLGVLASIVQRSRQDGGGILAHQSQPGEPGEAALSDVVQGNQAARARFTDGDELEDDSSVSSRKRFSFQRMSKEDREREATSLIQNDNSENDIVRPDQPNLPATVRDASTQASGTSNSQTGNGVFTDAELALLRKSGAEVSSGNSSGLIGGVRSNSSRTSGSSSSSSSTSTSSNAVQPTPTPEEEALLSGQVRGYELFYLMQPEARGIVERQVQALIDSQLNDIYLGVLVDGSFGRDFVYLRQVLDRLHAAGRQITLAIYAVNGPSMRRYDNTQVVSPYTRIEPQRFRRMIKSDEGLRKTFRDQLAELKPVLEYNLKLNSKNSNILVVMLEDNLDASSYLEMRNLAQAEIGTLAEYMRNPCVGCYSGNDSNSFGDHLILHDPEQITGLGPGDAFSLDGIGIKHGSSRGSVDEISPEQIRTYQRLALERGLRFFAYWDGERQGLSPGSYPAPAVRNYQFPTEEEFAVEKDLIQDGLSAAKSPAP
jgi:hypothetical protein